MRIREDEQEKGEGVEDQRGGVLLGWICLDRIR